MSLIRITGSQLHAARVLVGARAKTWRSVPGCAGTQSASGRRRATPSRRQPIRICAARSMYSRTRARGSAAMGSAHYPATHQIIYWRRYPLNQLER